VQFSTRLTCLYKYYLDSRKINGSYEKLVSLTIADRLKSSLRDNARLHVADKEGDAWQNASDVAGIVDLYEGERRDNYGHDFKSTAASNSGMNNFNPSKPQFRDVGFKQRPFVKNSYVARNNE